MSIILSQPFFVRAEFRVHTLHADAFKRLQTELPRAVLKEERTKAPLSTRREPCCSPTQRPTMIAHTRIRIAPSMAIYAIRDSDFGRDSFPGQRLKQRLPVGSSEARTGVPASRRRIDAQITVDIVIPLRYVAESVRVGGQLVQHRIQ